MRVMRDNTENIGGEMKYKDIPKFTRSASYTVDIPWDFLEEQIKHYSAVDACHCSLNLDPDFQRGHVWTEKQQRRYVEFILKGGHTSRDIFFNHPNWMGSFEGEMVLVDGKQRLHAVRLFLANKLKAFGTLCKDFEDKLPTDASFNFYINNLKTRAEILQWYLDLNDGGVVHTSEEIKKVRQLLKKEIS